MKKFGRLERLRNIGVRDQRYRPFRYGGELQRHLDDRDEGAERPAPQASEVVARDVLHDPAARAHRRTVAENDARADDPVARVEVAKTRWAPGRAREGAAHGRALRQPRLDRPALAARRERLGKLREGGPRADRRHEIAGLVLDDPVQR